MTWSLDCCLLHMFAQRERHWSVLLSTPWIGNLEQTVAAAGSDISKHLHTWRAQTSWCTCPNAARLPGMHAHKDFFVPCSSLPHKKTNRVGQERGMRKFSPGLVSFPLSAVTPGQRSHSLHFMTPQILKENSKTQSYTQHFSYFKPSSWSRTDLST